MPKFLLRARLTAEGVKGTLKDGGSSRREAIEKAIASAGGTMECFYYTFGDEDSFVICDLPDNSSAAAIALQASSSGTLSVSTTVLLTPEEIDAARGLQVDFRPPGG
jgi:uncharacterized protein with GYD domain